MSGVVLVTGASGGIGGALARAFAAVGYPVALGYLHGAATAQGTCAAIQQAGGSAMAVRADVADVRQVEEMFCRVEETLGRVGTLVNNAGHAQQKMFCDITPAEWDRMFDVHVKGAYLCTQRALGAMVRRKKGCILNMSSVWGQVGASCESHYAAAKAALIGLTRSLAKELGPSGVRVNCIAPGAVQTAMMDAFTPEEVADFCTDVPLGRLGSAEEVAALAVFLASDAAAYITGQVVGVNGGLVV